MTKAVPRYLIHVYLEGGGRTTSYARSSLNAALSAATRLCSWRDVNSCMVENTVNGKTWAVPA